MPRYPKVIAERRKQIGFFMTRVFMTKQKAIKKTINGMKQNPLVRMVMSSYSLLCNIWMMIMSTKLMLIRHKDMAMEVFIMFN